MAFSADYRTAVIVLPIWLAILFVAYEVGRRTVKLGRGRIPSDGAGESAHPKM